MSTACAAAAEIPPLPRLDGDVDERRDGRAVEAFADAGLLGTAEDEDASLVAVFLVEVALGWSG